MGKVKYRHVYDFFGSTTATCSNRMSSHTGVYFQYVIKHAFAYDKFTTVTTVTMKHRRCKTTLRTSFVVN